MKQNADEGIEVQHIVECLQERQTLNLRIGRSGDDCRVEVEQLLPKRIIHVVGHSGQFKRNEDWVEEVFQVGF